MFIFVVPACTSNPCQNGGSCTDVDGGLNYQCECFGRYEGTDCESLSMLRIFYLAGK